MISSGIPAFCSNLKPYTEFAHCESYSGMIVAHVNRFASSLTFTGNERNIPQSTGVV